MPQFIACSFRAGGRTYTYLDPTGAAAVGDVVRAPVQGAPDAWRRLIVEAIVDEPSFRCVEILGVHETAANRAARKAAEVSAEAGAE